MGGRERTDCGLVLDFLDGRVPAVFCLKFALPALDLHSQGGDVHLNGHGAWLEDAQLAVLDIDWDLNVANMSL